MYVFYYAQSTYGQFFRDELDALVFSNPEFERTILTTCDNGERPHGVSEGVVVNGVNSVYTNTYLDNIASGRDGVLVKAAGVGSGFISNTGTTGPGFKLVETTDVN